MRKLVVALRNFANAPNDLYWLTVISSSYSYKGITDLLVPVNLVTICIDFKVCFTSCL